MDDFHLVWDTCGYFHHLRTRPWRIDLAIARRSIHQGLGLRFHCNDWTDEVNNKVVYILCCLFFLDYCQPVFECNSCCACPETCPNRVVQKGLQLKLQVFKTKHKGWGLKTQQTIRKFTFVCEYAGELISVQEAEKRAQKLTHETGNYLIVLREHSSQNHILRTHVDARFHGNASRFINHSCNPNLVMVPVRVDSIVPRLALFAARDISAKNTQQLVGVRRGGCICRLT